MNTGSPRLATGLGPLTLGRACLESRAGSASWQRVTGNSAGRDDVPVFLRLGL